MQVDQSVALLCGVRPPPAHCLLLVLRLLLIPLLVLHLLLLLMLLLLRLLLLLHSHSLSSRTQRWLCAVGVRGRAAAAARAAAARDRIGRRLGLRERSATKEMMQPCLIHLHVTSLVGTTLSASHRLKEQARLLSSRPATKEMTRR